MSDRKKVHFKKPIHEIHHVEAEWDFYVSEGITCLVGWADEQRFKDRIRRVGETLEEVLDPQFRERIYKERFENSVIPEHKMVEKELLKEFRQQISSADESADRN